MTRVVGRATRGLYSSEFPNGSKLNGQSGFVMVP